MPLGAIGQVPNNSIIQGAMNLGIVEGVTTSTWNPRSGGTSKSIFKGTQAQVTSLAALVRQDGWEYSIQGGHVWTLEVIFPWDIIVDQQESQSNPLFIWELVNTPIDLDLYDLTDRPFIAGLSSDDERAIDYKLKADDRAAPPWVFEGITNVNTMTNAMVAYALRRSGVRGKQAVVQSLRRTLICPNQFQVDGFINASDNFKVFTKQQVLDFYSNNQANVLNKIPAVIQSAMPNTLPLVSYPSTSPVATSGWSMDKNGINTFTGYLQFPAEFHMVSTNKVQVTQHWVFNKWSAGSWGIYDAKQGNGGETNPTVIIS